MRFTVLSSGSKGNSLVVEAGETAVMIEAGLGPKVLDERMQSAGLRGRRISALVVTHGHDDHARRAAEIAESLNIPTYATPECAEDRTGAREPFFAHRPLSTREAVRIGTLTMLAFPTPHDAPGSVGLVFDDGQSRLGIVTDLGCVTSAVANGLSDVNLLYGEFNHDLRMLLNGAYPGYLKRRVSSNRGHLSNDQGIDLLRRTRSPLLRQVVLAHLSEQNNTPALALAAARKVLDGSGVELMVAPQSHTLGPITVGKTQGRTPAPRPVVAESDPLASTLRAAGMAPRTPGRRAHNGTHGSGPSAQLSLFGALPTTR